jgi:hypothetical protein
MCKHARNHMGNKPPCNCCPHFIAENSEKDADDVLEIQQRHPSNPILIKDAGIEVVEQHSHPESE